MSPRRFDLLLFAGDLVALLLFAALGRSSHGMSLNAGEIVSTALPFVAVWYPVGLWLRAFRADAVASPLAAARRAALAWLLAWPLGLQLRALILQRSIPLTFALLVLITNLALLVGWRTAYAFWLSRSPRR